MRAMHFTVFSRTTDTDFSLYLAHRIVNGKDRVNGNEIFMSRKSSKFGLNTTNCYRIFIWDGM